MCAKLNINQTSKTPYNYYATQNASIQKYPTLHSRTVLQKTQAQPFTSNGRETHRQLLVLASHRAQASCSQGFYRGSHCTLSMHIFEPQGPSWITGTHPIHLQVLSEFKNKWIGPKQAQLRLTQTIKGGGDVRESSTYH
jgi:hypothetical protein